MFKKIKPDPVLSLVKEFYLDCNPKKINFTMGEYSLNDKLYKYKTVAKTEQNMITVIFFILGQNIL